jgi:4-amino-4-deoxy-L-arabinose transferase-like glycosyltransferase
LTRRLISRAWTALIVFLLGVCLLGGLASIGLIGPDEPRYASIARAMARTGDWITPRLWGHPWFEKPVLYYWSAAASFRLFGESDWAARLPVALAALLGALLLGWAAWRLYGSSTARLALVLFPTSIGLFAFAHAATTDMLLAVSLEAAMLAALFALPPPAGTSAAGTAGVRRLPLVLVGVSVGLGTLAKGPVAILLAGGSVLLWAAIVRRWRDAFRFLRWEPVAAFAVVALPWYVACSLANPEFARSFLWYQNVERFLTPVFRHVQPFWYFGPIVALGLLPWTFVLLATARDGWRALRSGAAANSPGVFVACWAVFPFLFFSFSKSKLPGYILPALTPLVLLLARTIDRIALRSDAAAKPGAPAEQHDRLGTASIALIGVTWVALALAASRFLHRLPPAWSVTHQNTVHAFLVLTAATGIVMAALAIGRRPRMAVAASALWMGILVATLSWVFLPQLDPYLSARDAALAATPVVEKGARVEIYRLSRDWQLGLDYYFARALPEWTPAETAPAWVYTTSEALATISSQAHHIAFAVPLRNGLLLVRLTPAPPPAAPPS